MTKYLVICVLMMMGYVIWTEIPVDRGPGVTAENIPIFSEIEDVDNIVYKEADLVPIKAVNAKVRVLERKRYFFDSMSAFSSTDVLVGWDSMSDQRNLEFLHFGLSNRDWEHKLNRLPLSIEEIKSKSALWHLIPSTPEIKKRIHSLRDGHIITIEGFLVNVIDKDGLRWETSTELDDSKNPHNEIVWVTSFHVK